MGTNKAEEIKSVLTNDFGYDFESEFFTDEIKTLVDEVIEVTNNSSQSEIDELKSKVDIYESILNTRLSKIQELTKEVERLKELCKKAFIEMMKDGSNANFNIVLEIKKGFE